MNDQITPLWESLRDAGIPEVMLFLPDGTASRCHWDDTTVLGTTRVALVGDQERGVVRVVPLENCLGLGIAAPKGMDPSAYRGVIRQKIADVMASDSSPDS